MNVSLGGPIQAMSIQVSPEVQVQIVAGEAKWYEYNKVPYSNLLAGQKECLGRDETHQKLKDFFLENPQARYVARIAKALLIPLLKDLPKRPWSLILTHMVYRECIRNKRTNTTDFGGVGLFRDLLTDIVSYGLSTDESSMAMVARWAKNSEGSDDAIDVEKALTRWREFVFKKIGDKRLGKEGGKQLLSTFRGFETLATCYHPKNPAANSKLQISFQIRLSLSSSFGKRSCKESNFCKKSTTKKLQNIQEIDVKRFAKVEKIQGGELSDCKVPLRVIFVRIFWEKNPEKELQLTLGVEKMELWMMFFVKIWNLDCIIRLIWLKFWFSPDFEVFFFIVNVVHHSVIVEGLVFSCAGVTPGIGWSYVQQGYHAPEDEKGDHQSSSLMAALTHPKKIHVFHDEILRKPWFWDTQVVACQSHIYKELGF